MKRLLVNDSTMTGDVPMMGEEVWLSPMRLSVDFNAVVNDASDVDIINDQPVGQFNWSGGGFVNDTFDYAVEHSNQSTNESLQKNYSSPYLMPWPQQSAWIVVFTLMLLVATVGNALVAWIVLGTPDMDPALIHCPLIACVTAVTVYIFYICQQLRVNSLQLVFFQVDQCCIWTTAFDLNITADFFMHSIMYSLAGYPTVLVFFQLILRLLISEIFCIRLNSTVKTTCIIVFRNRTTGKKSNHNVVCCLNISFFYVELKLTGR